MNQYIKCNFSLQYITEAGVNLTASRVFWLIAVIAAASIGIQWSCEVSYVKHRYITISV